MKGQTFKLAVVALFTTSCNIAKLCIFLRCVFVCLLLFSQQTPLIPKQLINAL